MVDNVPLRTSVAASPFDDREGDLVLRSSDNVDFYVYKAVLRLASSVFADMFVVGEPMLESDELQTPVNDHDGVGIPVVNLSEDSIVLGQLLRFIYPVANPQLSNLKDIFGVASAASKYMIDYLTEEVKKQFNALAQAEPLKAYTLACSVWAWAIAFIRFCPLRFRSMLWVKGLWALSVGLRIPKFWLCSRHWNTSLRPGAVRLSEPFCGSWKEVARFRLV